MLGAFTDGAVAGVGVCGAGESGLACGGCEPAGATVEGGGAATPFGANVMPVSGASSWESAGTRVSC